MATYNIIVEQGEDGFLISEVIGLPGCHSQAKTYDELMKRTKEAIKLSSKVKQRLAFANKTVVSNYIDQRAIRKKLL